MSTQVNREHVIKSIATIFASIHNHQIQLQRYVSEEWNRRERRVHRVEGGEGGEGGEGEGEESRESGESKQGEGKTYIICADSTMEEPRWRCVAF